MHILCQLAHFETTINWLFFVHVWWSKAWRYQIKIQYAALYWLLWLLAWQFCWHTTIQTHHYTFKRIIWAHELGKTEKWTILPPPENWYTFLPPLPASNERAVWVDIIWSILKSVSQAYMSTPWHRTPPCLTPRRPLHAILPLFPIEAERDFILLGLHDWSDIQSHS